MLAKVLHSQGDLPAARDALVQAASLDASSPAIQCDLANLLLEFGEIEAAVFHFRRTVDMSPDSEHGADAAAKLAELGSDQRYAHFVSFQEPWVNAPRTEDLPPEIDVAAGEVRSRLLAKVELGAMYNSNVELAPISRQLSSSERGGVQTYAAPELEYLLLDNDALRLGTVLNTYFSFNESQLSSFNLQHYAPGVYLDRDGVVGNSDWLTRVQYDYAVDLFGGQVFGTKHGLTTSLSILHERPVTDLLYWTIDYTDFRDDGTTPDIDSVDGLTNTIGLGRSWDFDNAVLQRIGVGADGQWAELRGSDHAYRGVYVYAEAALALPFGAELIATGGWGYRDYPDFSGTPSRNENLYVGGLQIDRQLGANWRSTLFFNYDSFDADNTSFAAERYTTGLYLTFQH